MKVKAEIRLDGYKVLDRIVEDGCAYGWMRINKYRNCITQIDTDVLVDKVRLAVSTQAVTDSEIDILTDAEIRLVIDTLKKLSTCPTMENDIVIVTELSKAIMGEISDNLDQSDDCNCTSCTCIQSENGFTSKDPVEGLL